MRPNCVVGLDSPRLIFACKVARLALARPPTGLRSSLVAEGKNLRPRVGVFLYYT